MMMKSEDDSDQRVNLIAGCDSDFTVHCSICLELVVTDGSRSRAKLQCGHEFHLDCIGSAFNVKGIMQCPNCRNVEKGQWLYAIGPANLAEQYPFFLVPYGFRICPFRGFMPSFFTPIPVNQIPNAFNHHRHPVGPPYSFPPGVRRSNRSRSFPALSPAGRPYHQRATFYHPHYLSTGSHIPNYSHTW